VRDDDPFVKECDEILASIKQQLDNRRRREATIDQEIKYLTECRSQLQQINIEYVSAEKNKKKSKNREVKRLNNEISHLKKNRTRSSRSRQFFPRNFQKRKGTKKSLR